jgi:hypothetical protein
MGLYMRGMATIDLACVLLRAEWTFFHLASHRNEICGGLDRMRSLCVTTGCLALTLLPIGCSSAPTSAASGPGSAAADASTFLGDAQPAADGGASSLSAIYQYQSTASVGDFIRITLDKNAQTVSYENKTNGLHADNVHYSVDATGVYSFAADPNGHLKQGIELAGYAFVVDVDKAGPGLDTRALAIGAASEPISASDLASRRLNVMQFRTKNGGIEVGNVALTAGGGALAVALEEYWPRGAMLQNDQAFHVGAAPVTLPIDDEAGAKDFLVVTEAQSGGAGQDFVFKTPTGLAIDTSNGNLLMIEQPSSKDFDSTRSGHYRALLYGKVGAMGGPDNAPEPGAANVVLAEITVDSNGHLTAVDSAGGLIADNDLTPVGDATYLTGPGRLDPAHCNGIFTFRTTVSGGYEDIFVVFTARAILLASFTPEAGDGGDRYDYFYGAGLMH